MVEKGRLADAGSKLELLLAQKLGSHPDVDFLYKEVWLHDAISRATSYQIDVPENFPLAYWFLEASLRDVPDVAEALALFARLLQGKSTELPEGFSF